MNKNWSIIEYPTKSIIQIEIILNNLRSFWKDIIYPLKDNEHVLLLIKIHFQGGIVYSLGKLNRLNKEVKPKMLLDSLEINYNKIIDSYNVSPSGAIGLSIYFLNKKGSVNPSLSKDSLFKSKLVFNLIKKLKLPIAYKPEDYGQILFSDSTFWSIAPNNRRNTILQIKKKKSMEKVYIDFL
jgi:hypothetical protein